MEVSERELDKWRWEKARAAIHLPPSRDEEGDESVLLSLVDREYRRLIREDVRPSDPCEPTEGLRSALIDALDERHIRLAYEHFQHYAEHPCSASALRSSFVMLLNSAKVSAILATQAAELDALRGEVELVKSAYRDAADGWENASTWLSAAQHKCAAQEDTIAQLRDRVAGLETENERLSKMVTSRLLPGLLEAEEQATLVDFIKCLRADEEARALLTQNEVG